MVRVRYLLYQPTRPAYIQGLKVYRVLTHICLFIATDVDFVYNACTTANAEIGGTSSNITAGPVQARSHD
jgi:hypothetical protein